MKAQLISLFLFVMVIVSVLFMIPSAVMLGMSNKVGLGDDNTALLIIFLIMYQCGLHVYAMIKVKGDLS
ncbi:TMhelix containing protein [Vibrio phage 1.244.A._10N.261.54.C3]|nr:TMhelix containing protein [Vibrio phage 1.244.A._10N.261.54.C3]AUR98746.1 TMhelix containing protein [Vibrio phage 1.255.O._10N.286.45.F1]